MRLAQSKPNRSTIIICTNVLPVLLKGIYRHYPRNVIGLICLQAEPDISSPFLPGASSFLDPSGGLRHQPVPRLKPQRPADKLHGSQQRKVSFVKWVMMPPRVGSGPQAT